MIDTHCHLTDERVGNQLSEVLARAAAAGVDRVITIGTDLEDDRLAVQVCRGREAQVRCVVGVHPNYTQHFHLSELPQLHAIQSDPAVVALGEMGLDYHHHFAPREHQARVFEAQLQMATELDRPVVIHSREAIDDTLAILKKFPAVSAVFHSFTGSMDEARRIIDAGYLMGFTGPVTFKKNDDLRKVVEFVPADRMLVETDAPYLSPEPVRKQKINEPGFVVHVARMIAEVKGMTFEEVDAVTTGNAERFFRWG